MTDFRAVNDELFEGSRLDIVDIVDCGEVRRVWKKSGGRITGKCRSGFKGEVQTPKRVNNA